MARTFITNITPLPNSITREVAVAQLHDHSSMIELNPLVLRHERTRPAANASPDEAERATWYEITDKISYLPGGLWQSELSYKACFYNLPTGLQTHVFAPAGVDIRAKWSVGGNMPGEPRETAELGVDTPKDGLYYKEEVDLRCNILMIGFVKGNLNKSHKEMTEKLIAAASQKAEYAQFSPPTMSPQEQGGPAELHGSAGNNACLCTGGLHQHGCPQYPGLRSMTSSPSRTAPSSSAWDRAKGSAPSTPQEIVPDHDKHYYR